MTRHTVTTPIAATRAAVSLDGTCSGKDRGPLAGIDNGIIYGLTRTLDHNSRIYFQCDHGYSLTDSNVSICQAGSRRYPSGPPQCTDTDDCSKYPPRHDCSQVCVNTDVSYECQCNARYSLDSDEKGCKPVCKGKYRCLHGVCSGLNKCDCDAGWEGDPCNDAICQPTCLHGRCVSPQDCICMKDWDGPGCTQPICGIGGCKNGGTYPNTCSCLPTFKGTFYEIAACDDLDPPCKQRSDIMYIVRQPESL